MAPPGARPVRRQERYKTSERRGRRRGALPVSAALAFEGQALSRQRLHNDLINLGAVEGPLRMFDQRSREGEHGLGLFYDSQRFLVALLDERRDACRSAANE